MNGLLFKILIWSEVWAPVIPLLIIIIYGTKGKLLTPVAIYVFVGLLLNTAATLISYFYFDLPSWLRNNNILYNLHSVARVILFGWYITNLTLVRPAWLRKMALIIYSFFVLLNLIFIQTVSKINVYLLSGESVILLALCIIYFINSLRDDNDWLKDPSFLVCAGVSFYEAITFFIFLFYYQILNHKEFGMVTMQIYSVSYIILCLLLAFALYGSRKKAPA